MPDFGIFRGFNEKLFGDKLYAGQLPTQLGLIGSISSGLLLDFYPNAAAAYSLRKLRVAYTGDAIEVRRASDNTTQDIGFVSGELDTTSLESFCSGTDGFVTTWYDQSGNGNDATQGTASNQPQIVSSGSVILENGKPAVQFDGSDDVMDLPTMSVTLPCLFFVINPKGASSGQNRNGGIVAFTNVSDSSNHFSGDGTVAFDDWYDSFYSSARVQLASDDVVNNQQYLGVLERTNTNLKGRLNGIDKSSVSVNIDLNTSINRLGNNNNFYPSNNAYQEIILYPSDQSSNRTGIETNINDFYSIY